MLQTEPLPLKEPDPIHTETEALRREPEAEALHTEPMLQTEPLRKAPEPIAEPEAGGLHTDPLGSVDLPDVSWRPKCEQTYGVSNRGHALNSTHKSRTQVFAGTQSVCKTGAAFVPPCVFTVCSHEFHSENDRFPFK